MILRENERIDDLGIKNLKIIQNKEGFCFGIDSVLLSDFAKDIKKDSMVMDLGTGTGIIPILLCGKTKLKKVIGVEIQKEVCEMAKRSIELNNLEDKFQILNENILDLEKIYSENTFDVIVTNPPYKKMNTGILNENEKKLISRHEYKANLEDFLKVSKRLLKDKGEFYMVHRPERLVDILFNMRKYKIEPKNIRFVFSNKNKEPKLVLIKGIKNANPFLKIENNLYIYDEDGNYKITTYLYSDEDYTQPIKDTTVTVWYEYDFVGLINIYNDIAELHYKLWGEEWDEGTEKLNAHIQFNSSEGIEYWINPYYLSSNESWNGSELNIYTGELSAGEFLEFRALIPLSQFNENPTYAYIIDSNGREEIYKIQQDYENSMRYLESFSYLYPIVMFLSLFIPVVTYLRYGKEPKIDYDAPYEHEPPTNDHPLFVDAMFGTRESVGVISDNGIQATILK